MATNKSNKGENTPKANKAVASNPGEISEPQPKEPKTEKVSETTVVRTF